ncbi:DUF7344 domain-containing protein [Natronococcus wangiae]|uniref:DUF7344 domain-containing protein n=1 Tax=Natronococcus wangiae TaxID=3068275 RepID=UPI0027403029|nr:hypothetical protein [Natronococcus sp. AD5]
MIEERQRSIPVDVLFETLANEYCRYVLRCLCEHETPISIADLAREVAVRKHGASVSEIPEDERKRIHVLLHHSHVPKLDDADLVTHDQERNVVDTPADADVESLLESLQF